MPDRVYEVTTPATIAGYVLKPGDTIPHDTIMRRTPHQLGSLLRRGTIVEAGGGSVAAAPSPDFDTMSKPGLKKWATKHDITIPGDVTLIADIRAFLKEEHTDGS